MSEEKKKPLEQLKERWGNMNAKQKQITVIGSSLAVLVLAYVYMESTAGDKKVNRQDAKLEQTQVIGAANRNLTVEDIAAAQQATNNRLERLEANGINNGLTKEDVQAIVSGVVLSANEVKADNQGAGGELGQDVGVDKHQPEGSVVAKSSETPSGDMGGVDAAANGNAVGEAPLETMPSGDGLSGGGEAQYSAKKKRFQEFVANEEGGGRADKAKKHNAASDNGFYVPLGATFKIATITGLNAPTNEQGQKTPMPVIMRVRGLANLPNNFQADYADCLISGVAFGQIADERALVRTVAISCMNKYGQTLEGTMDGTLYGEDGKVGLRGRMVSKTGQVVSQMLKVAAMQIPAQVLVGLANNIQVSKGSGGGSDNRSIAVDLGGASQDASKAASNGVANIFNRVAGIYEQYAQQTFPVIEVNAGRNGTVTVNKGFRVELVGHSRQKSSAQANNK